MSAVPAAPDQIVHVVDDDEALRDSLAWMLEANGHGVVAHESGEAFLAACTPEMTGCVLLDVRIPKVQGGEAKAAVEKLVGLVDERAYSEDEGFFGRLKNAFR